MMLLASNNLNNLTQHVHQLECISGGGEINKKKVKVQFSKSKMLREKHKQTNSPHLPPPPPPPTSVTPRIDGNIMKGVVKRLSKANVMPPPPGFTPVAQFTFVARGVLKNFTPLVDIVAESMFDDKTDNVALFRNLNLMSRLRDYVTCQKRKGTVVFSPSCDDDIIRSGKCNFQEKKHAANFRTKTVLKRLISRFCRVTTVVITRQGKMKISKSQTIDGVRVFATEDCTVTQIYVNDKNPHPQHVLIRVKLDRSDTEIQFRPYFTTPDEMGALTLELLDLTNYVAVTGYSSQGSTLHTEHLIYNMLQDGCDSRGTYVGISQITCSSQLTIPHNGGDDDQANLYKSFKKIFDTIKSDLTEDPPQRHPIPSLVDSSLNSGGDYHISLLETLMYGRGNRKGVFEGDWAKWARRMICEKYDGSVSRFQREYVDPLFFNAEAMLNGVNVKIRNEAIQFIDNLAYCVYLAYRQR